MSHREMDDDYDSVETLLGLKWRVIRCCDDIQWIVQEKSGDRWRSRKYCTSRDGVLRWTKDLPGLEALANLPERYPATRPKRKLGGVEAPAG
jgi:hypothetical protein